MERKKPAWQAEFEMTDDLARRLIDESFPDLRPCRLKTMAEGWDNVAYEVNEEFVFRFPRRDMGVGCMEAEIHVLPYVHHRLSRMSDQWSELRRKSCETAGLQAGTGAGTESGAGVRVGAGAEEGGWRGGNAIAYPRIAIPNPAWVGAPSPEYPYPFAGYRRLEGLPPHIVSLSEGQRRESAARFGAFLRAVHDISGEEAARVGAGPDTIRRLDVPYRTERLLRNLRNAAELGVEVDPRGVERIIKEAEKAAQSGAEPVLVHGDLNFRNFLVDSSGILCGVIDWGDVHVGHPAVDMAVVVSFMPPEGRQAFLSAYGREVDESTWALARLRALYVNLYIVLYAIDIGDEAQLREARQAISYTIASVNG